ncbi:MAG TPA: uroporphyrinogen decarboxylase family protein, partial [Planctomycetota bacterium]|nr:uroporphyrinogen decarboxylase family protein [Planctomycetota bacterium]
YRNFRAHLGLPAGRLQVFETMQQIAKLDDDVREMLEVDTVPLYLEPCRWKPGELSDGSPCEVPEKWNVETEDGDCVVRDGAGHVTARMPGDGFYFEPVFAPLADTEEPSELDAHADAIDSFDWPSYADESLDDIETRARKLHEETDLAVVANLCMHLLAAGQILRGYENFMVDLLANKSLVHALLERLTDAYVDRCDRVLGRVGQYVQAVLVTDDLGTQTGPMLSVDCYKEMVWPYQKRLFGHIRSKTDAAVLMHSCGSVYRFIPMLIEAGVDALNPVQVSAAEMDTARLKREFGRDLTFWGGGCDTQRVLPRGSLWEIEDEVKRRISDLAPGGGFVFTQVHNIQPDVLPENVVAMVDAFRKYRCSR